MNTRASGRPLLGPQSNPGKARRRLLRSKNTESSNTDKIDSETENRDQPDVDLDQHYSKKDSTSEVPFSTEFSEGSGLFKTSDSSEEEDNQDKTHKPDPTVIPRVNQPVRARRMDDQEQPVDSNNRIYGDRRRNVSTNHPNARNEQVNAITTRACNTYNFANPLSNDVTPLVQVEADEAVVDEMEMEPNLAVKIPAVPSKTVEKTTVKKPPVKPYQSKIPFRQRLRKAKIKENFKKLGHMIFLVDFVVLEMEADVNVPLIIGRPFLMTTDAIIHVKANEISIGVGDDRVVFNVDRALKHPYSCDESCFRINVVDEEDALEKELMDILDMEEDEAFLACSEEEQEMVGEMV
uniref:uncharacterized protein LOC122583272 n=1 Tax=Erigeron canadensis TaxID=72917 RepID=UPI001CB9C069|nr:uncharacterized protein LOC122583272 [Erigeron canadensis]